MARETLLERVPVPASQVERIRGEDPPEAAARAYEAALRAAVGAPAGEVPRLDLALLGLGADGHTASLVPGDPALEVRDTRVTVTGEYQGRRRMTLTYPALEAACAIVWLVTGIEKADALTRFLARDPSIPAGRIENPARCVVADEAALAGRTSVR
jgi:6-phosphogluconolactonase